MIRTTGSIILFAAFAAAAFAQPEVMAWGNLTGLRVDGHLLELSTSMCVAQPEMAGVSCTGREKQQNSYSRNGKTETVTIQMRPAREFREPGNPGWAMAATEVVEDTGPATARVDVEFTSPYDADIGGAFLGIELPAPVFSGGSVELIEPDPPTAAQTSLAAGEAEQNEYLRATATGARFISRTRQIEVTFNEPTQIIVRDDRRKGSYTLQVLLAVIIGKTTAGQTGKKSFSFKVTDEIDKRPVEITLDASHPGQMFDGFGGNFRLQSARDSQVIDYSLENIRIAWGRVELPWFLWHPDETTDPLAAARAGNINPRVQQAMEMARRLAQKGMPVIVSAWHPPNWAILGGGAPSGPGGRGPTPAAAPAGAPSGPGRGAAAFPPPPQTGPRGNPLNPEKMARIKDSITGYLLFLKEKYGVEATLFSFNESDLGIDVRQTPREHAELIKTLGAYFAAKGLATRLALGDTSDANPVDFIKPAMHDPEAVKYIGAVDFHSWRGCTDEILAQWRDAARELNVPLVVAEGSTDAAAYRYPQIFNEQSFALYEINLYLRILAIAQPRSILQWQFTADYSVLAGGGIFNDNGPLRPTRRFWNLKQLASTPPRSFSLPVACDKQPNLTCAAFGDIANGIYTVHIVNNGATRTATLTGVPPTVKQLRLWVTDAQRGMQESDRIPVTDGKAQFSLAATSYTTVIGGNQ
jgi:O-glycosyl hydrolase